MAATSELGQLLQSMKAELHSDQNEKTSTQAARGQIATCHSFIMCVCVEVGRQGSSSITCEPPERRQGLTIGRDKTLLLYKHSILFWSSAPGNNADWNHSYRVSIASIFSINCWGVMQIYKLSKMALNSAEGLISSVYHRWHDAGLREMFAQGRMCSLVVALQEKARGQENHLHLDEVNNLDKFRSKWCELHFNRLMIF